MRFTNGWVKIHRKCLFGDIGQNPICLALWVKLLGWANLADTKLVRNGAQVTIPRGSLVTSTRQIADDFGISQPTIRRWLLYLKRTGRISILSDSRGTVVTILNYNQYQDGDAKREKPRSHEDLTDVSPRSHQDLSIEEEKKIRRKEEKNIVCTELSADASRLGAALQTSDPTSQVFQDLTVTEFLTRAKVKLSTQALWVKTYGDKEWLRQEILKAIAWLDANKAKAPKKNFARFLGNWFSKGWEWHRKSLPSEKAEKTTDWDYVFGRK